METYIVLLNAIPAGILILMIILYLKEARSTKILIKEIEEGIIKLDKVCHPPQEPGILFVTSSGELSYTPEGPDPQVWEDAVVKMNTLYCISGIWREEVGKS